MKRFGPITLLLACLLLLMIPAAAAAAGTTTGIVRAHGNVDVFTYTPAETGYLNVELSYTDLAGNPLGGWPYAEVDVVVQGFQNGQPYYDLDIAGLYVGTNPISAQVSVSSAFVSKTFFFTVSPFAGEARYHLVVTFRSTLTGVTSTVIDATGDVHASDGEFFLPSTATSWLSVFHEWPGILDRSLGQSDVYANWEDYAYSRDSAMVAENWSVEWTAPVVTNVPTIDPRAWGKWITTMPQIWNGAAQPNVWANILSDQFPMPGSLAVGDAQAWYTWSYGDSAATTSVPAYAFATKLNAAASGQSFSFQNEPGAQVSYAFVGDALTWRYAVGPDGGTATVVVDGMTRGTVDQYAADMGYGRQLTLAGLGVGAHTVAVTSTGTLYHDAFVAPTDVGDVRPVAENHSDGTTKYRWATMKNTAASGGSYSYAAATDAATAFTFTGTAITWQYVPGPTGGIAEVWIDGVNKGPVDQYQATAKPKKGKKATAAVKTVTYSGLVSSMHTILIRVTGTANASSTGTVVTSDAFTVGTVLSQD
jgi:hypothetical protein